MQKEILAVIQLEYFLFFFFMEKVIYIIFFSEDRQSFQAYLRHIVCHPVCIRLDGYKAVCTSEE